MTATDRSCLTYDVVMPIDRCVCFNVPFRRMKEFSEQHCCGLVEIREHFGCGRGCALCVPYIQAMLATGKVEFPADFAGFPDQPRDSL